MDKDFYMFPPAPTPPPKSFIRKWGMLIVLSLALAIIIIDTTLLNVSLGVIIRDLHTDIQSLQWVITAYALMLAAFTITGGRMGDLFGRKRMFLLGAIIFAIGSFTASISHQVSTLIWGEAIIEGIGAALMMPATASLLVANFKGRDRALAFGVWGGIAAASAAIGPILGGWLTTHYSWRWGFRINVVVAALLLLSSFLVPESRDREERPNLDMVGVVLSALGLLAIVFGIIESETYGWFQAKDIFHIAGHALDFGNVSIVLPVLTIGAILLTAFIGWEIYREEKGGTPLVSMKLFENKQFSSGTIVTAVLGLGQSGLFFVLPVFFQSVKGLDALHTGLALLPMPLAIFITAPTGAFLGHKLRAKYLIMAGFVINIVAIVVLYTTLSSASTIWQLAPGLFIYGVGMGLIFSQISNLTLSAVSTEQAGEASGVNNTVRQLGASLGSAIIGAVLITGVASYLSKDVEASTVIPVQYKQQIAHNVSMQSSNIEFGGGAIVPKSLPQNLKDEIVRISKEATTKGDKQSILYAGLFMILGLGATFLLPKEAQVHPDSVGDTA
jgi:EmrB/QacA subfamily drug resistance transporter